ncbi:hypothetical protein [Micromonospora sp. WMMD1219]|uniref:hypothetical protein n=1 Tax=Micromonospora sp. WMMD1219 TaxID=3404115 RepID=UPI003BF4C439
MDVMTAGVALPALHRDFVDTVRRDGSTAALHACVCFAEQLLSDTTAAAPAVDAAGLAPLIKELRELCTVLARDMATDPAAPARAADERIAVVKRALGRATAVVEVVWRSAAARRGERTAALLRHAADWKTPECYGYDLADPELSLAQAADWLTTRPGHEPVLVVAVRTGGSYLAPFWQAAAEDAGRAAGPWHSVRPVRAEGGIILPEAELAALPPELPSGTVVVLVDDQPDTGVTAKAVRDCLAERFPSVRDITLAAPGRLYDPNGPVVKVLAERPVVRNGTDRLWQHADAGDIVRLADRARSAGVPLASGGVHRSIPFRGPFLSTYGTVPASAKDGGARRIDPRTRPFSLVVDGDIRGQDQAAAYHFRFIGTGPHGLHCYRALRAMSELLPPGLTFVDGYLVTPHETGLQPLRENLLSLTERQRRHVLGAVARSWHALRSLGEMGRPGTDAVYDPRERLGHALRQLRDRMRRSLAVDDTWLTRHVPNRALLGGTDGVLFRTPLPYGHGFWHWQLTGTEDAGAAPALRRFGLDWIWGGGGCLESEIASFTVENRLDGPARDLLREAVGTVMGDTRAFDAGLRLCGEALYWNIKTWLRRCPVVSGAAADRIEAELAAQANYVVGLG